MHLLRPPQALGRGARPLGGGGRRPVAARAAVSGNGDCNAHRARRAFSDPFVAPLPPGSEHGEAFSSMSGLFGSGGARRLDVDALNEQLTPKGMLRLRHASRPDEAHGAVFAFDSVVADLAPVKDAAWRLLARRRNLPITESALRAASVRGRDGSMAADAIASRVFGWARDYKEAQALALAHAALGAELLASDGEDLLLEALRQEETEAEEEGSSGHRQQQQHHHPLAFARDGAEEWLSALSRHGVPTAAVSSLDRRTLQRCLQRVGLHDHFDALVTADDEPESLADRLLMACVKLQRPPRACASFDATPEGITAAHNASLRVVAVAAAGYGSGGGGYGGGGDRHALRGADLTVFSLRELSVYNVRRLFAGTDAPGRMVLAREGAERERGGGDGGDDEDDSATKRRWQRWSSRRATAAAPS
jgi:beta-phosphoglucomutase-like phosphatase (HAD superfamily)